MGSMVFGVCLDIREFSIISQANGIAFAGTSVGSFVWPFLLEWLVNEFNLRGAMLIYGGESIPESGTLPVNVGIRGNRALTGGGSHLASRLAHC